MAIVQMVTVMRAISEREDLPQGDSEGPDVALAADRSIRQRLRRHPHRWNPVSPEPSEEHKWPVLLLRYDRRYDQNQNKLEYFVKYQKTFFAMKRISLWVFCF